MSVKYEHFFDYKALPIALGVREQIELIPGDYDSPSVWRLYVIENIAPEVRFSLLSWVNKEVQKGLHIYRIENCTRESLQIL